MTGINVLRSDQFQIFVATTKNKSVVMSMVIDTAIPYADANLLEDPKVIINQTVAINNAQFTRGT
jgi:hypothetical protein